MLQPPALIENVKKAILSLNKGRGNRKGELTFSFDVLESREAWRSYRRLKD